ncbi:Response regulator receiver domain-containing protein [Flavobacteriaceae bacterium MAR_2010_188]|nr:Response regulator receiver domain-containing protein [Flavobacteriaceae bacterium MAR_2010_188]
MDQHITDISKTWHILLADDDDSDRLFFGMALKKITTQTQLTTVEDGERLIYYLKNNSINLPNVIFLDLNMPRKTGHECLLEIRNDEKLKDIPIVIYSTSLHEEVAEILYQNGANYYLKKSNIDELPGYIKKTLSLLSENPAQPSKDKFILNNRKF